MLFYENYVRLCNSVGKTPSAVALEIGIAKPTVTRWKNGSTPNSATLYKVADYFGVSVEELTSGKIETPAFSEEDERRTIEALLNSLSREELLDLMAKTAEKLKERGLG